MKRPLRRGLVLGAGGILGAAWTVGTLNALEEVVGFDPREVDVLVGTSAGSVLAALLACGVGVATLSNHQLGESAADDVAVEFNYDSDAGGPLPPLPRLGLGSASLLATSARRPWRVTPFAALAAVLPAGRGSLAAIGELVASVAPDGAWPVHPATWIVSMDYDSARRVAFGRPGSPVADLAMAVMASCAIPAWYAPVTIGGRRYVDGGVCSPTSLDLLAGQGLDEVYVLSPMTSFAYDSPSGVGAKLERHLRKLLSTRLAREAAKVRAGGTRVTLLGPGPEDLALIGANLMDPTHRLEVFRTACRTSAAVLASASGGGPDLLAVG